MYLIKDEQLSLIFQHRTVFDIYIACFSFSPHLFALLYRSQLLSLSLKALIELAGTRSSGNVFESIDHFVAEEVVSNLCRSVDGAQTNISW